jgi:hypothetical protein
MQTPAGFQLSPRVMPCSQAEPHLWLYIALYTAFATIPGWINGLPASHFLCQKRIKMLAVLVPQSDDSRSRKPSKLPSRPANRAPTKRPTVFIFHDHTNANAGSNKAAINAHIAQSSHDRRRRDETSRQKFVVSSGDSDSASQSSQELVVQIPSPITLLDNSIDALSPIPALTTRRDRALLHLYLVDMPTAIYGTHQNAAFCPIRDGSYQFCHTDEITLQWVLLYSDTYISTQDPRHDKTSIFKRKTYAYHLMGKMLAEPKKQYHIDATAGLGAAAIAEARWGDFQKAKLHFEAVKFIIDKAGGAYAVQDMPLNQGVILLVVYLALVALETPVFPRYRIFEDAKTRFVDTMVAMQAWNRERRRRRKYSSQNRKCDSVASPWDVPVNYDAEDRTSFFGPSSPLRAYVEVTSPLVDPVSLASHFVILYNLNFTLFDLRDDAASSSAFLKHLAHDMRAGSIPSSKQCTLKPMTVVLILANRSSLAGEKRGLVGGLWRSWKVIDVMRLMRLVDAAFRSRLLALMSAWLTGDEVEELDEEEVKDMENVMEINWLKMGGM